MAGSLSSRRTIVWGTAAVVLLFAAHAGLLIARSTIVVDGKRYFCLFDDAMISLTYARNWAEGHGLVWNVGEKPVEGYTNFGWVAVMAALHLPGWSPSGTCLAVQIVGVLLGGLYIVGAARLGVALNLSPGAVVVGSFFVAACYNLEYYSALGMETGLLAALVTFAIASAARGIARQRVPALPFALLALAPLVRMDAVLVTGVFMVVLLVTCPRDRARTALFALLALVPMLVHLLWRHDYYGQWLPNTYSAKVVGWPLRYRLLSGAFASLGTLRRFLFPLAVCVFAVRVRPRAVVALILGSYFTLLGYQLWVGGDVWPRDRFTVPLVPALLVLVAAGLERVWSWLRARAPGRLVAPLAGSLALLVPLWMNQDAWREILLTQPPLYTDDNERNLRRALAIGEATSEDALIGVYYAGVPPYFVRRPYLDFLGKSDAYIARLPVRHVGAFRYPPGHGKWSWPYALGQRRCDVVTQHEGQGLSLARDFQDNYVQVHLKTDTAEELPFWVRRNSPKVRWELLDLCKEWDPKQGPVFDDP